MEISFVLYSLLLDLIARAASEQSGLPVININGCCSSQETNAKCVDQFDQNRNLVSNISKILENHEKRVEAIVGSLETVRVRDCQDIQRFGHGTTGIYTIFPEGTLGFPVRCDMDTKNGGWTVIQRRVSDSDFYKTWNEYQIGFGDLNENFWLGNQQIHKLSSQGWYELRVDLVSQDGEAAYAEYNVFLVGDVESGYKLTVDGYSGNAGSSLSSHSGMKFSTKDKDNDPSGSHCAQTYTGAWWYESCHSSNLNGKYGATGNKGPRWGGFKGSDPMKETEMKIRRWRPPATESL